MNHDGIRPTGIRAGQPGRTEEPSPVECLASIVLQRPLPGYGRIRESTQSPGGRLEPRLAGSPWIGPKGPDLKKTQRDSTSRVGEQKGQRPVAPKAADRGGVDARLV